LAEGMTKISDKSFIESLYKGRKNHVDGLWTTKIKLFDKSIVNRYCERKNWCFFGKIQNGKRQLKLLNFKKNVKKKLITKCATKGNACNFLSF
jgi:REP element-mobilizing transposase RayT